jgi:hypothetical protein
MALYCLGHKDLLFRDVVVFARILSNTPKPFNLVNLLVSVGVVTDMCNKGWSEACSEQS